MKNYLEYIKENVELDFSSEIDMRKWFAENYILMKKELLEKLKKEIEGKIIYFLGKKVKPLGKYTKEQVAYVKSVYYSGESIDRRNYNTNVKVYFYGIKNEKGECFRLVKIKKIMNEEDYNLYKEKEKNKKQFDPYSEENWD